MEDACMTPETQKQEHRQTIHGRVLGLDYGSKTVGVAVSDPLRLTAQGVEIIRRKSENKLRQTLARICELASRYQAETIVLGFPRNMNATIGERAEAALAFGRMLKKRSLLPVVLWDERLTTVAADRIMDETGVRDHKAYVDEIAAMLILQGYLDRLNAGLPVPGGIEDEDTAD
jgi:putative Holliday junction resolvase